MPLFEVETDAHIIITWAADENAAKNVVREAYPGDKVIRLTKRPRDTWVISKGALGLKVGAHRGWKAMVPRRIKTPLKRLRQAWLERTCQE